jgi:uncharacterized membrane protein YeiH
MSERRSRAEHVVAVADLAGTFVFAVEGALTAISAGLDPIGVLVLAFLTALGGGLLRDLLIGATPPAAISNWAYSVLVVASATGTWFLHPHLHGLPANLLAFDAAGLSLFAVAGTQKCLDRGLHPVVAIFVGPISAVGGGALRDIVINQTPRVLREDIYATAALLAAVLIVAGRALRLPARPLMITAGLAAFALRMAAVHYGWRLPTPPQ